MFSIHWFFFIIPVFVLLFIILLNFRHSMKSLQKKDIWLIALIVVVCVGATAAIIFHWNYELNQQMRSQGVQSNS